MVSINCDMGESFGIYQLGDDKGIMPYITHANVACGFHGSDPDHIQKTVSLAKQYGVAVGAHFSLPDLQGFGRREMKMSYDELLNSIVYQVGALNAFVQNAGMELSHLKPHGALYGMAAKYDHVAKAVAQAARVFDLPVFGMAGSLQEKIYREQGVKFVAEFFADLDYDKNGGLIITREHQAMDVSAITEKVKVAIVEGKVKTESGNFIDTRADTICVHSDTPNAVQLVAAVSAVIKVTESVVEV